MQNQTYLLGYSLILFYIQYLYYIIYIPELTRAASYSTLANSSVSLSGSSLTLSSNS